MLRGTSVLCARRAGKRLRVYGEADRAGKADRADRAGKAGEADRADRADKSEACDVERTRSGTYNLVLFLRQYDDVVVRVSRMPLDEEEQREYYAEIETHRALARAGVAPRVFGVLHFTSRAGFSGVERPYARRVRLGYAMGRYDSSLAEALARGYEFTRRSKRALVELFERAATVVRCVDTTAANVVVRYGPAGPVGPVGHRPRPGPRAALAEFKMIDVDGYFCGTLPAHEGTVDEALRAWGAASLRSGSASSLPSGSASSLRSAATASTSSGAFAALGLLVLCVHSRVAWLARMLLKHEVGLVRLLADDAAAETMESARDRLVWTHARVSAMHMVRVYSGHAGAAPWDVPEMLREIAGP